MVFCGYNNKLNTSPAENTISKRLACLNQTFFSYNHPHTPLFHQYPLQIYHVQWPIILILYTVAFDWFNILLLIEKIAELILQASGNIPVKNNVSNWYIMSSQWTNIFLEIWALGVYIFSVKFSHNF